MQVVLSTHGCNGRLKWTNDPAQQLTVDMLKDIADLRCDPGAFTDGAYKNGLLDIDAFLTYASEHFGVVIFWACNIKAGEEGQDFFGELDSLYPDCSFDGATHFCDVTSDGERFEYTTIGCFLDNANTSPHRGHRFLGWLGNQLCNEDIRSIEVPEGDPEHGSMDAWRAYFGSQLTTIMSIIQQAAKPGEETCCDEE